MQTPILLAFGLGALVGLLATVLLVTFRDWRSPSSQRAFRKMWRLAKKMNLEASELTDATCALDLSGDRLLPLLCIIRDEDLSLEQSAEALDRLRSRVIGYIPENVYGWRRTQVGRKAYPELDARLKLPQVPRGGVEDPVDDFDDIGEQLRASQREMLDLLAAAEAQRAEPKG